MNDVNLSLCGICGSPAQFTDASPGANPVSYCSSHLPEHLRTAAAAGQMPLSGNAVTVSELRGAAAELDIEGRSSMNKDDLVEAVSQAQAQSLELTVEDPTEMSDGPVGSVEAPEAQQVDNPVEEPTPAPKKASKRK